MTKATTLNGHSFAPRAIRNRPSVALRLALRRLARYAARVFTAAQGENAGVHDTVYLGL